jgi:MFS family permease
VPGERLNTAPPTATPVSAASARNILVVLTAVNLFNYIDRFVVPGLAQSLKESPLQLSDARLGLLATGFLAIYALVSPLFGRLGDTRARPRAIAAGVGLWSIATVLGGFATSFVTLLGARALVGVGEAAYGTIAPSVLADCFPLSRRGRVFAIFYAAIPIGGALGYVLAGVMNAHFGWRSAFFVAGIPGLLLTALVLRLPDPPRGAADATPVAASSQNGWQRYRDLIANAPYVITVLGYAAYTFALGGLAWWMPAFLERVRGVPREQASVQIGLIVVVTGFVGTFAGGWLGDVVLRYTRNAYLLVSGIATLLAAPCALVALMATRPTTYMTALVAAELLLFVSTGPINTAIINSVAATERATAMAVSILLIHLLGDVPSPYIVGLLSDARVAAGGTSAAGLQHAVLILPMAIIISGVIWTAGAFAKGPISSRP